MPRCVLGMYAGDEWHERWAEAWYVGLRQEFCDEFKAVRELSTFFKKKDVTII